MLEEGFGGGDTRHSVAQCPELISLWKIQQPKVIAEVLGGILLGPTAPSQLFVRRAMCATTHPHVVGHAAHQVVSHPSLVANIGLDLFLSLVGVQMGFGVFKCNSRLSATVALAGTVVPFRIGGGLAVVIYNDPSIEVHSFHAVSWRVVLHDGIYSNMQDFDESKLLDTTVVIVILSGHWNRYHLLAFIVALVNASSGLTALYILLTYVDGMLLLPFLVKMAMRLLARTTGSLESSPSLSFVVTATMMVVFGSAFFRPQQSSRHLSARPWLG